MSIICLPSIPSTAVEGQLLKKNVEETRRSRQQEKTTTNMLDIKKGKGKYPIAVSKRKCNRILCSIRHIVIGRNCGIRLSAQAHTTTRKHGRPPHKQHPPHSQSKNHHSGNRVTMVTKTRRCYVGEKGEKKLLRLLESEHRQPLCGQKQRQSCWPNINTSQLPQSQTDVVLRGKKAETRKKRREVMKKQML